MNWAGNTSVKEEELAKSRLSDAHFNISELFFLYFILVHLIPSFLLVLCCRLPVLYSHLPHSYTDDSTEETQTPGRERYGA